MKKLLINEKNLIMNIIIYFKGVNEFKIIIKKMRKLRRKRKKI